MPVSLFLSVDPALDNALEGGLVLLASHLASALVEVCVGLDEDFAWLGLGYDDLPDLAAPVFEANAGHFISEELGAGLDVCGGFVDVDLLQKVANG